MKWTSATVPLSLSGEFATRQHEEPKFLSFPPERRIVMVEIVAHLFHSFSAVVFDAFQIFQFVIISSPS